MMADKVGIKELLEWIEALRQGKLAYKAAMADGKVDLLDITILPPLVAKLFAAFQGSEKIAEEFKDLDSEELALIGQKLVDAIFA